jgi:hypothetical protein
VGSLDVEIATLSEQIDMAEQQTRDSDEDRLATALEQSRIEHEQARLDLATSASLGAHSLPVCSTQPFACVRECSYIACRSRAGLHSVIARACARAGNHQRAAKFW